MRTRLRPAAVFAAVVSALPLLAAIAAVARGPWTPVADDALIALRTGDVFTSAPPLVGVYSRFRWNHPGPALFLTLAPFQAVLGTRGLVLGAGLVGSAALAFSMWLLWRRGGAPLVVLMGCALVLLAVGSGGDLVDPWNPYVSVVPLVALMAGAWSVLEGDRWILPVVVGIASWLVQVHLGYVLLAVVLAGVAVVARLARRPWRDARAELAVTAGVLLVAWLPPIVQQLTSDRGNLSRIVDTPARNVVGLHRALGVAAQQIALPRGWLLGDDRTEGILRWVSTAPVWWLLLPLVAWLLAGIAVWRRTADRDLARTALRYQALAGVLVPTAVVSVARIQGLPFPYLVRWQWVVAMFVWTSVAWSALVATGLVVRRDGAVTLRTGDRTVAVVAGVVATILVCVGVTAAVRTPLPDEDRARSVDAVVGRVVDAIAGDAAVRMVAEGDYRDEYRNGIGAALERRGIDVQYPVEAENRVGARRARPGGVDAVLVVATGEWLAGRLDTGQAPVVVHDPLTPAERTELDRLERRSRREIAAVVDGRTPADPLSGADKARQRALTDKGPRFGVFREVVAVP